MAVISKRGTSAKLLPGDINRQVLMMHGLGCSKHDNCFTCPLPSCQATYKDCQSHHIAYCYLFADGENYSREEGGREP